MAVNGMDALGELICRLNPYTELPEDQTTGLSTGDMAVAMTPADQLKRAKQHEVKLAAIRDGKHPRGANNGADEALDETIAGVEIEVVNNYGAKWSLKGQSFSVKTAVRIPYRFPVFKNGKLAYWQTENLLIGYAGGEGPG
jgi:hypothetical protein